MIHACCGCSCEVCESGHNRVKLPHTRQCLERFFSGLKESEPDEFGDVDEQFNPTNDEIARALHEYICPAGEPWTGDDPTTDHGHTQCMWIGLAIQRLRAADGR